jgi:hypothetical protein
VRIGGSYSDVMTRKEIALSAGICPPEVKQVEVTCHLMNADFFLPFFYTVA